MFSGRKKPDFCDVVKYEEAVERLSRNDASAKRQKLAEEFKNTGSEDKPELMSYLASLPEVEEEAEGGNQEAEIGTTETVQGSMSKPSDRKSEVETEAGAEESTETCSDTADETKDENAKENEEEDKETPGEKLANYIRIRTRGEMLTSLQALEAEIDQVDLLVELMEQEESCSDIKREVCGENVYFYSDRYMTSNYAMITALIDNKDIPLMLAKLTRFNCKTYPTPTPLMYFERHPYNLTKQQVLRAVDVMSRKEEYKDIQVVINNENKKFLYSIDMMSTRYAKSLVDVDLFTD